ncbi:MAG: hypothetical protein LC793_21120 [Thermomicrobia bacterium]|nr:hypothetical protein [Thermomicrobia bacterium]
MPDKSTKKTCFVISPVGAEDSQTRANADMVLRYVIEPAATASGYEVPVRADQVAKPGIITHDIISRLLKSDLVIADLSEHNPNVFYELAIRHATNLPCIHIVEDAWKRLPFDVAPSRTIVYSLANWASRDACLEDIKKAVKSMENNTDRLITPISAAIGLEKSLISENAAVLTEAQSLQELRNLQQEIIREIEGMSVTDITQSYPANPISLAGVTLPSGLPGGSSTKITAEDSKKK